LAQRERDLVAEESKMSELMSQLNDLMETQEASHAQLARLQAGDFGSPRAHIRHANTPLPPIDAGSRWVRWWAAISGGLVLLLIVGIAYFRPPQWPLWLLISAVGAGAIDALSRRRLTTFLLRVTLALALVSSGILLYQFWLPALVLGLALIVIITIRDNLREVWR
jgi:hypothetical protein